MTRMKRLVHGLLVATLMLPLASVAQVQHQRQPIPLTPQQEQRYRALLPQLRCLVCQNESLAESQAALAADLRYEVRGLVARGDTKKQVKRYMVERYGDYVLLKPPFVAMTWLLWFGPFLIVLLALVVALQWMLRRRRAPGPTDSGLDEAELKRLLDEGKR